jgi:hypothetical protein
VLARKPLTPAADISPCQAAAVAARPGERYFILVFGSQGTPKRPKYTHSWATVVKVARCDGSGAPVIEESTISWLPTSLDIRPLSPHVEPGTNFALHFTIEEMLRQEQHISVWGPYEVRPGLVYRFQVQKWFLESGRIGYQCIDSFGEAARTGNGCDCIHAVTDMDPLFSRGRYPLAYFGEADHGWLLPLLVPDRYPLERQSYHGPTVPYTPENWEHYLRSRDRDRN